MINSTMKDSVSLSWPIGEAGVTYNVYRSGAEAGPYDRVNVESIDATGFVDTGLASNTRYYYKVTSALEGKESALTDAVAATVLTEPDFGDKVYVFDQTTPEADIQQVTDNVFNTQITNQFGSERYALLFKPGAYNSHIRVGFYTHVAGLGIKPDDVTITGGVTVDADWWPDQQNKYNATQNFWRSVENLKIIPKKWSLVANEGDLRYAVSQAASMRRLDIEGNLTLHDRGGWASGGYLADSYVSGTVVSGSQQQWFNRNDDWGAWNGANWNMVFVGTNNAPADSEWPAKPITNVAASPVIAEKPFLIYDQSDKQYKVFIPGLANNTSGTSWRGKSDQEILNAGKLISLENFYIAKPETFDVNAVNAALASGKHLFLTPGVYQLSKPIEVTREDTVIFGLGLATLHANDAAIAMKVADVDGVKIAGLLFEAGTDYSPVLLEVGPKGSHADHSANPTSLYDLYFRVGGDALAQAEVCIEINSNHVIGDHFWVWRADHGIGAGWDLNLTKNGLVVNGNDVTIYGLFVEHFHEYQTLWNGERGTMFFYQSEIPYDVPSQDRWMSHGGTVNGYAAYKVADHVKEHQAYGLGVYSFFRDAAAKLESAIEVPDTPGVIVRHASSVFLTGKAGSEITHIVNDAGGSVTHSGNRQSLTEYIGS